MMINIRPQYSELVSIIQKNWKDETINLTWAILSIIRHFEFMEDSKKYRPVIQNSQTSASLSRPTPVVPTVLCKNPEYIEKSQTTYYTNRCQIKYHKLRQKYAFGHMWIYGPQKNLKVVDQIKVESTLEIESWQPMVLTIRALKQSC